MFLMVLVKSLCFAYWHHEEKNIVVLFIALVDVKNKKICVFNLIISQQWCLEYILIDDLYVKMGLFKDYELWINIFNIRVLYAWIFTN